MKTFKKEVYCKLQFEAIHNWTNCPIDEVGYLRNPHRHIFHIKAFVQVNHNDRDQEFIVLKHRVTEFLNNYYNENSEYNCADIGSTSCEMLAELLINQFNLSRCEVNEDNENGAILTVMETL